MAASTPYVTTNNVTNILGGVAGDLVGMHGSAVAQAAAITTPGTNNASVTTPWGFATSAQASNLTKAVDSIITALINKGIIAAS